MCCMVYNMKVFIVGDFVLLFLPTIYGYVLIFGDIKFQEFFSKIL